MNDRPDVLLIDVGGVVIKSGWELLSEVSAGEVQQDLMGPFSGGMDSDWLEWRSRTMSEHDYWQRWSTRVADRYPALTDPIRDVHLRSRHPHRAEVLEVAAALRDAGIRLAAVSNGVRQRIGLGWYSDIVGNGPLKTLFEATALGVRKPGTEFFARCAAELESPLPKVGYVDDNPDYVAAARKLGLACRWFDVTAPDPYAWLAWLVDQ